MDAELACQELVELVTDYLEGALPSVEQTRIEQHLAVCDGCEIYLDQMRRTVELTGQLRVDDVPPEAALALLAIFRDAYDDA
jgi:predicted anti-sigma-YlaC factor YlaD